MARRKHRKRNTALPFLAGAALVVVAALAVAIALFFNGPKEEVPADGPAPGISQTITTEPQTDPISDLTSSGITDSITETDTESETETTTESTTDTNEATDTGSATDSGNTTDTKENSNTGSTVDTPKNPTTIKVTKPADGVKRVAFTFDDGPYYKLTPDIADMFVQYGGKCTFFVVGNRIAGKDGEAMVYAASKGHEIAIHGYTHEYYYNECSDARYEQEVNQTRDAIINAIGTAPTLLRPPGGVMKNSRIQKSPYSVILWNVDPKDWESRNTTKIVNHVLKYVEDGDIILLHDLYKSTRDAVEILLPKLKEMGYEFVTVSELMGDAKAPGQRYSGGYN